MLKLNQISKTFSTEMVTATQIFSDFNLSISRGEFVTIIGGNGAGKSSLLNLISGHFLPDDGEIYLDERKITKQTEAERAKIISRVFQNPLLGTAPNLTVAENLALALKKGCPLSIKWAIKRKQEEEFRKLLLPLNLGLEDKLDLPVKYLSGGQRQALTLLMATTVVPQVLLLDEHTAALDPKTAHMIMELTDKLVREHNLTTIMVTHNMEQAIKYGDRLLMFQNGQVVLDVIGQKKKDLTTGGLYAEFHNISFH